LVGAIAPDRTQAHEYGHAMGNLPNAGTPDLSLMQHGTTANTRADLTLGEYNALNKFTSD